MLVKTYIKKLMPEFCTATGFDRNLYKVINIELHQWNDKTYIHYNCFLSYTIAKRNLALAPVREGDLIDYWRDFQDRKKAMIKYKLVPPYVAG